MKRIDMHIHTCHSFDCLNDPGLLMDTAAARGIDILCITDHNEIATALRMKERFPDRVIVGEEVKTAEGVDIIGLFITQHIPKRTPARETCERIRAQGGIVYVPHPYAKGKGGDGRILDHIADLVHVVEGFNARLHDQSLNERAVAWAKERGLPVGAGSDAHTLRELGAAYVELPGNENFVNSAQSFLTGIVQGTIHGRESSRLVHVASTYAKLHKTVIKSSAWT